jgi:hypothetical protein
MSSIKELALLNSDFGMRINHGGRILGKSVTKLRMKRIEEEKSLMKQIEPKRYSEFIKIALKAGATAARIIPARQVVIDVRVRFKCEVPRCAG